jgi:hypothetical protein
MMRFNPAQIAAYAKPDQLFVKAEYVRHDVEVELADGRHLLAHTEQLSDAAELGQALMQAGAVRLWIDGVLQRGPWDEVFAEIDRHHG